MKFVFKNSTPPPLNLLDNYEFGCTSMIGGVAV